MGFKSLLILIIILIALLSFVYFFERHAPSTDERLARSKQIFSFDEQAITFISIINTDSSSPFILNKESDSGVWRLTKPVSLRANKDTVIPLLSDLKFSTAKREIKVSEADISELGLNTPTSSIDFSDDTYSYSLALGNPTAVGGQVYALTRLKKLNESGEGEQHIVILDAMIEDSLDVSLNDLRTQHVIPQWSFAPDSIIIERDELKIELQKHSDNTWYIVQPLSRKADDTTINELLITLNNLKILDYLTDSSTIDNEYGFQSPRVKITLSGGSKQVSVLLGNEYDDTKRTYVKNNLEICVYGIDSKTTPILFSTLSQLSAHNLTIPEKANIRNIQIRKDVQELTIEYSDGQWHVTNPVMLLADEQHIEDMLDILKSYKIDDYIIDPKQRDTLLSKIDINAVTVVFNTTEQEERPISYTFFDDLSDHKKYVVDNMTESLRCISSEKDSVFPSEVVDFAQKNVLRINRHLINQCSVVTESTQYNIQQRHGTLFCNDKQLTEDDAKNIFEALEQICVQNLIDLKTDENLKKHHLDTPSIEIHTKLSAKPPTGSDNIDLLLGDSHETIRYGYMADYPLIFVINETAISTLQDALKDISVASDNQD